MRVIIVGRDLEVIGPLADRLIREKFDAVVVDNIAGVQSCLKKGSIQFLAAEPSLLVDHNLGRELLKRCPLARLVALAAQPSLVGMVGALSSGLTDYFPRFPEYFDQVVETLVIERRRLLRWQGLLLSESIPGLPERPPGGRGENFSKDQAPALDPAGLAAGEDHESPGGSEYAG